MVQEASYSPTLNYEFTRAVRFLGVDYNAGDPLQSGVPARKVEQLLRQRMVRPRVLETRLNTLAAPMPKEEEENGTEETESQEASPAIDLDSLGRRKLIALCKKHGLVYIGSVKTLRSRLRSVLE